MKGVIDMTFGEILVYCFVGGIILLIGALLLYLAIIIFKAIFFEIQSIVENIKYKIQLKKTQAMYEKASKTGSSEDSFEKHNDKAARVSSDSFKGYNSNDTSASSDSFAEYNKRAVNDGLGLEVDIVNGSDAWKYEDHDENGNIF